MTREKKAKEKPMSDVRKKTQADTRRAFLKTAAAGALAAAAAPRVFGDDKAGAKLPVVGSGEHTYEVIHDWGTLPDSIRYGNTHGVCEDASGRILVHHTVHAGSPSDDTIVIFDAAGKFVKSWGPEFKAGAHGLLIAKEGNAEFLYLADQRRGIVVKADLDGRVVYTLACPIESGLYANPGEYHPTNVAVAPGGDLYVADGYGKNWIHQYTAKGEYVRSFGGPGKERGQVACPHGIFLDARGATPVLVVADRSNRRLQYFSLDGRHIRFATEELRSPCHFDTRGGVLLVPDLEARVSLFDKDDRLIAHLGDGGNFALRDKPREAFLPGKFIAPHGACFDHEGNIFVVEWVEVGRVTKLRHVAG
jgi:hypothetical protein